MIENTTNKQPKILIVDDREDNLKLLEEILDDLDVQLVRATSGNEALCEVLTHDFALVLLDVQMPGMDGFETAELMRSNKKTEFVPIVFVSANTRDEQHIFRGCESGAVDYLFKPLDSDILKSKVRVFLELHRQREQLKDYADQAAILGSEATAAAVAKTRFQANMSHEMRTPLTAILGYADLIHRELAECDARSITDDAFTSFKSSIEVIQANSRHLLALINDVLDLAKIESGSMSVEKLACSPLDLMNEVLAIFAQQAHAKGIQFCLNYQGSIPEHMQTDPTRVRQALLNLVGNAVKFTTQGSVTVDVSMAPDQPDAMLFKVTDTGPGIAEERLNTIFTPYMQADITVTRQFGGTGLGLTLTKWIAEALGGRIEVTSQLNQGSSFMLTLPTGSLKDVSWIENPEAEIGRALSMKPQEALEDTHLQGRVLLAEDTPANQTLICRMLKKIGLDSLAVENGQLAIEALEASHYDLVLMDLHMPVLGGLEATDKLRSSGNQIPIIAITADIMKETQQWCKRTGFDGYITKPVAFNDFVEEIKRVLAGNAVNAPQTDPPQEDPKTASGPTGPPPENSEQREDAEPPISPQSAIEIMHISMEEYLEALEQTLPWLIEQQLDLGQAVENDDLVAISRSAHAIKGASGSLAMKPVHKLAYDLESIAKGKQAGDWKEVYRTLSLSIDEAVAFARDLVHTHAALPS